MFRSWLATSSRTIASASGEVHPRFRRGSWRVLEKIWGLGNVRALKHTMGGFLVRGAGPFLEPFSPPEDLSKSAAPPASPARLLGIEPIGNVSLDDALAAV